MAAPEEPNEPTLGSETQDLLVHYVRIALERLAAGETIDAAALCSDHPDLARPVAEALGLGQDLPALQAASQSLADPLQGVVLAERYRLQACIGRGAMGAVYRADDLELKREVAVKILDARRFADPQAEQRFLRESETLAALHDPAIIAVHDRGRSEGILYLVMDLLEGAPLSDLLEEFTAETTDGVRERLPEAAIAERSPLRLAVSWCEQLARALGTAHRHGVFHRDVKPSNVFLTAAGRPVLLDFGIAARQDEAQLTATSTSLGTPWYMPPEQLAGTAEARPAPSAQLDVYSLSATLYHLLAGQPPYGGEALDVLSRLAREEPTPIEQLRPDLPRDLRAIVERGMERAPGRRYQGADELADELQAFLEHRPVRARPLGPLGRQWRRIRRRPARAIAAASIVVAAALAAVLLPTLQADAARQRAAAKDDLLRSLPSLLALEGQPSERLIAQLGAERQRNVAVLDRILELDPEDLSLHMVRAALLLDQGEHDRAAEDLSLLAASRGSPYLRELSARYRDADRTRAGVGAVDLGDLPEPQSPHDHFLAGFHELRNRHVAGFSERALKHLDAAAPALPAARDLRLIALLAHGDVLGARTDAGRALFTKAYEEATLLAGSYGAPTARTLATAGAALVALGRYDEAIEPLQASLELRPDRHGPLNNLGVAYRRLGKLDQASESLAAAAAVRPHFWNTTYTAAQVARDRGQFAAAYALAEQVPTEGPGGLEWKQPHLVANIAVAEALALRILDPEGAIRARQRALAAYDRALPAARGQRRTILQVEREMVAALHDEDFGLATRQFLQVLRLRPDDPYQLRNLAGLIPPEGLGTEEVLELRLFLWSLARKLAVGDEELRQEILDAMVQELEGR